MASIVWSNTSPGTDYTASAMDDKFRSIVTSIAVGLGESFFWDGSAASQGASVSSSGQMKLGTARSAVSNSISTFVGGAPNGYVGIVADESYVQHIGSAQTVFLGGGNMLEHVTDPAPTARWVLDSGTTSGEITDAGTLVIPFSVTFTAAPTVLASVEEAEDPYTLGVYGVNTTQATSAVSALEGGLGAKVVIVRWEAYGQVAF
jgi:hypothetical protein